MQSNPRMYRLKETSNCWHRRIGWLGACTISQRGHKGLTIRRKQTKPISVPPAFDCLAYFHAMLNFSCHTQNRLKIECISCTVRLLR